MAWATLDTPTDGSRLAGTSQYFAWSSSGCEEFSLCIGSTPYGSEYGAFTPSPVNANHITVTGLPYDGRSIYASLFFKVLGFWRPPLSPLVYTSFKAAISFVCGSTVMAFSLAPLARQSFTLDKIQPREVSAVDAPIVYPSLATDDIISLTLRMTDAERLAFEQFYVQAAHGMAVPFTYVDVAGVSRTVKFNQVTLDPRESAYNMHQCNISLRVQ